MPSTYEKESRRTPNNMPTALQVASAGDCVKVVTPAGETSDPVFLGGNTAQVCAQTNVGGGTVKVQASWSSYDDIVAGGGIWHDWDYAAAAGPLIQQLDCATAVRLVATAQAGTMEVSR